MTKDVILKQLRRKSEEIRNERFDMACKIAESTGEVREYWKKHEIYKTGKAHGIEYAIDLLTI